MEKVLNTIGLGILVLSIFIFGLKGMDIEMGLAIGGSGVFLAFVNINKFSKFKGAGFEAELKQTVEEANLTINNLKELAIPLIITNLNILAKANRLPESTFDKSHDIFEKLIELQSNLKLESDPIEISKSHYLNIHAWDMINDLSRDIETNGEEGFFDIVKKTIGERSYDKLPNLKRFLDLASKIDLNESQDAKLKILEGYYKKYLA